jgi:hypothetical protein
MAEQTHSIVKAQQDPSVQALAAAAIRLRERARHHGKLQIILAIVVPVGLVTLKIAWEPATPAAVLYAIIILLVFTLLLDRSRTAALAAAARAFEKYETEVLSLNWNSRVAGNEPSAEDLAGVPATKSSTPSPEDTVDLYPPEVDQLPLEYGRVACQCGAASWNSEAAARYLSRLRVGAGVIVLASLAAGLALQPTAESAMTTLIALTPMAYWILREQRGYKAAGQLAARINQRAESAWRNAMAETMKGAALNAVARGIQDDVYAFRAARPVTPRWALRRFWLQSAPGRPNFEKLRTEYARMAAGQT